MTTAYVSAVPLAIMIAIEDVGPSWLGWPVRSGERSRGRFCDHRGAGFFSPPILAHLFTGAVGLTLLLD